MNRLLMLSVCVLLVSCDSERSPTGGNLGIGDNLAAGANTSAAATMSLLNTTWEFSDDGTPMVVSVDQAGAYVEERGGKLFDHGSYEQKNGKDCFTTAMGDKGTNCWTAVPQTEIGETASARADDGSIGVFRRVDYRVLKVPGQRRSATER
jgi:hypothetical protein